MDNLVNFKPIGTATIDLRLRTINGGWGALRRALPIKGLATASAIIAGHALTRPATINVLSDSLALAADGQEQHVFAVEASEQAAKYLHLAGLQSLFFPPQTGRKNIQTVIESLCQGHQEEKFSLEVFDSQSRPVPTATWDTFYPDASKLTLLQRTGLGIPDLIKHEYNIRYFLPVLEQPGGTIEAVREKVKSYLEDLGRRKPLLPAINWSLITGYCSRVVETIERAVEENAPTIRQQLDQVRTINFL